MARKPSSTKGNSNAKKRPSNARKPQKKSRPNSRNQVPEGMHLNSEYHNLVLIFLGLFLAYGLYSSSGAILPKIIQNIFKGLFGALAIIAPIIVIGLGILGFIDGNEKIDRLRKTKVFYFIIAFLIIYYGLINYVQIPPDNMLSIASIQDTMKMGVTKEGIGLIPTFITYHLTRVVGLVGAWLITIFATAVSVMYVFKISIQDILTKVAGIKDVDSLTSKFNLFNKDDEEEYEKTGFFSRIKNKFSKSKDSYEDDTLYIEGDDEDDKTIKIVGFNKAEDDYLEILEGTQSLSDLEILQKLQNEGAFKESDYDASKNSDTVNVEENVFDNNKKLLQFDDIDVHTYYNTSRIDDNNDMSSTNSSDKKMSTDEFLFGDEDVFASSVSQETKSSPALESLSNLKKSANGLNPAKLDEFAEINEHEKYKNYKIPPINLLNSVTNKNDKRSKQKVLQNAKQLEQTLRDFGVDAAINQVTVGPTITRYEIQPRPGVKVSKIVNLTDDIALSLAAKSIRMEAPIPGKSAIGIEVPNDEAHMVGIKEIIESNEFKSFPSPVAMGLGKDVSGNIIIGDIAKMPHLLIAGSTGSGKSVCVNTLITSIIYKSKPNEVKLMLIDPKVVELANYNGIPHLLIPVVTDPKKAANALCWAVTEMNRRYKLFAETQVKDITSYNEKTDNPLPKIVIIIDELADLMMVSANEVEDYVCRLAQMARAAGMHLIVATQRPSVDVITGVIKANIPSRIAFAVSSQTDSRTIIDMGGAEKLLGKGDMLFYPLGASKPKRLQGAFISEEESEKVIEYVKKQAENIVGNAPYVEQIEASISNISIEKDSDVDEFLFDAIEFVVSNEQASASMLQRKFKIGFNRAARLIDDMEERGIIGPSEGSKPRKVLISKQELDSLK